MYKQFFFVTKNKDWPCHLIIICVCEVHTLYREFCCLLGRSYFQGLKVGWQELLILTVTLNLLLWLWGHLLSTLTSGVLDVLMCWAITDVSESLFFFFFMIGYPIYMSKILLQSAIFGIQCYDLHWSWFCSTYVFPLTVSQLSSFKKVLSVKPKVVPEMLWIGRF